MNRRAFLPTLALLLIAACTTGDLKPGQAVLPAVPFLTKPTGTLTIPRQQFVNTWTAVTVIFDAGLANAKAQCKAGCVTKERCARIPEIETEASAARLAVEVKLRNPEAEIDWANIEKLLTLAAKFVF